MRADSEKIFFVQKINEAEFETESLWCTKVGDYYVIDNIPFIAKRVSLGDTIKAEYDKDDKAYYFDDFIDVSGNSTVRIYFEDESIIEEVREQLKKYGCESEAFLARKLVAVNIPKAVNYKPVKDYLEKGEDNGLWTYEESCLAHRY
jgi:hypothetical protein